jgi:hypothetical protein
MPQKNLQKMPRHAACTDVLLCALLQPLCLLMHLLLLLISQPHYSCCCNRSRASRNLDKPQLPLLLLLLLLSLLLPCTACGSGQGCHPIQAAASLASPRLLQTAVALAITKPITRGLVGDQGFQLAAPQSSEVTAKVHQG